MPASELAARGTAPADLGSSAHCIELPDPCPLHKHHPKYGSRAIRSGDNAAVAVPLKARDCYGDTRVIGPTADRGAVEKAPFGF